MHGARDDEQVGRAVHEQEAQVAPAVAEARELGLAAARVVLDRELADVELLLGGPDDHLRRELHAGGAQVQARQDVAAHARASRSGRPARPVRKKRLRMPVSTGLPT